MSASKSRLGSSRLSKSLSAPPSTCGCDCTRGDTHDTDCVCLISYDCFYLKSGGEFKGNGDGGFINVSDTQGPGFFFSWRMLT